MMPRYAGLQPGIDPETTQDRRRLGLHRVLAAAQMRSGRPDIHPGGETAENSLLSRGQFAVILQRRTKPWQLSFHLHVASFAKWCDISVITK